MIYHPLNDPALENRIISHQAASIQEDGNGKLGYDGTHGNASEETVHSQISILTTNSTGQTSYVTSDAVNPSLFQLDLAEASLCAIVPYQHANNSDSRVESTWWNEHALIVFENRQLNLRLNIGAPPTIRSSDTLDAWSSITHEISLTKIQENVPVELNDFRSDVCDVLRIQLKKFKHLEEPGIFLFISTCDNYNFI